MDKAIFRISKIKSKRTYRAALAHNLRQDNTPNINTELSHQNVQFKSGKTIENCVANFERSLDGLKVRKNAVLAHEVIVTGSPEKMAQMSRQEQLAYFQESAKWLIELHGGDASNLVSMSVHYDESTPHAHLILVPKIDNKLNSRAIIGGHRGRLSELQTEFHEKVASRFGLTRGEKNSRAKHEHYSELKTLENRIQELTATHDELTNKVTFLENDKQLLLSECNTMESELERIKTELQQAKHLGLDDLRQKVTELEQEIYRPSFRR